MKPTANPQWHRMVVLVSLTVTARVVAYTEARCQGCGHPVMGVPGRALIEMRRVRNNAERSGRGRVAVCRRCKAMWEVIEHRGANAELGAA